MRKTSAFASTSVEQRSSQLLSTSSVLISPRIFLSRLRPHPSPLLHCLRLCLNLRLSPTRLSAGREYSCQLIDPVEIDSWAGGSKERGRYRESVGVRRSTDVCEGRTKRPRFSIFILRFCFYHYYFSFTAQLRASCLRFALGEHR